MWGEEVRCGVACGGLFLPELLFEDDTSLFGEDVQGLEHIRMVFKVGNEC